MSATETPEVTPESIMAEFDANVTLASVPDQGNDILGVMAISALLGVRKNTGSQLAQDIITAITAAGAEQAFHQLAKTAHPNRCRRRAVVEALVLRWSDQFEHPIDPSENNVPGLRAFIESCVDGLYSERMNAPLGDVSKLAGKVAETLVKQAIAWNAPDLDLTARKVARTGEMNRVVNEALSSYVTGLVNGLEVSSMFYLLREAIEQIGQFRVVDRRGFLRDALNHQIANAVRSRVSIKRETYEKQLTLVKEALLDLAESLYSERSMSLGAVGPVGGIVWLAAKSAKHCCTIM